MDLVTKYWKCSRSRAKHMKKKTQLKPLNVKLLVRKCVSDRLFSVSARLYVRQVGPTGALAQLRLPEAIGDLEGQLSRGAFVEATRLCEKVLFNIV